MFWKVAGFSMTSPVSAILERGQFTVEELLREDDLIQECRSLNGRLINILGNKENVETMLKYMLQPPNDKSDDEDSKKLSWQSCEVFCCEVESIYSVLLGNEDTMAIFMGTLERDPPLHSTTAGYFGRVMSHLLLKRPDQLTQFLMDHSEYMKKFVDHLEDTSIMEIVMRLTGGDEQTKGQLSKEYTEWIAQTNILRQIMNRLEVTESDRVRFNAAQVLIAIVRSRLPTLTEEMATTENLDRLLELTKEGEGCISVPTLSVIVAVLETGKLEIQSVSQSASLSEEGTLFRRLREQLPDRLSDFADCLDRCDPSEIHPTPYGALVPPVGLARLKIVETMATLMMTIPSEATLDALMQSRILEICMELFIAYPFSNVLHKHVLAILIHVLKSEHRPCLEYLFEKLKICTWLIQMPKTVVSKATRYVPHDSEFQENGYPDENGQTRPTLRAGYWGHVIALCNQLISMAKTDEYVTEQLEGNVEWQKYVQSVVLPTNQKEDVKSWECGRPSEMVMKEEGMQMHTDGDLPSSSNGALYSRVYADDEEGEEEEGTSPWRTIDVLTSEGDEVTATAAMLSSMGLRDATVRVVKQMTDSSSSSSSSSSSHGSSSSSSSSSDEEDASLVMITPQTLIQNLRAEASGSGREMEEGVSTSEAQELSTLDDFNAFNFWKLDYSSVDFPDDSVDSKMKDV